MSCNVFSNTKRSQPDEDTLQPHVVTGPDAY